MSILPIPQRTLSQVVRRLNALSTLDPASISAIEAAVRLAIPVPIRRDIITEGQPVGRDRIIVEGWAARIRIQMDGRRQFLNFLLPGDIIGLCTQPDPLATATVTALTPLKICLAPSSDKAPMLAATYAMSKAFEDAYLLDQIARLGRLNAQERILHLLLELHERLAIAGLAEQGSFEMPLTQEQVADSLGLTPVHLNRMIQQARREFGLIWRGRHVTIADVPGLSNQIGRMPVCVSGSRPIMIMT